MHVATRVSTRPSPRAMSNYRMDRSWHSLLPLMIHQSFHHCPNNMQLTHHTPTAHHSKVHVFHQSTQRVQPTRHSLVTWMLIIVACVIGRDWQNLFDFTNAFRTSISENKNITFLNKFGVKQKAKLNFSTVTNP